MMTDSPCVFNIIKSDGRKRVDKCERKVQGMVTPSLKVLADAQDQESGACVL